MGQEIRKKHYISSMLISMTQQQLFVIISPDDPSQEWELSLASADARYPGTEVIELNSKADVAIDYR